MWYSSLCIIEDCIQSSEFLFFEVKIIQKTIRKIKTCFIFTVFITFKEGIDNSNYEQLSVTSRHVGSLLH